MQPEMSTLAQTDSADLPETDTLSERAANLVERDIIAGLHAPGARLGIVDLARRYEIGATPLREGLSRLVSRPDDPHPLQGAHQSGLGVRL